jgi:secreted Zn-dependent insulinase-like peptidase
VDARGFSFSFSGYTQQLPKLGRQIFEHLANIDVTPEVFGRLREELERMQKNWKKSNAMAKASFLLNRVAKEVSYTAEEKLRELQTLTGREVIKFGRSMLREMFVEAYFHGSIGTSVSLARTTHAL